MSLSKFIFHAVFTRHDALITPFVDLEDVYNEVDTRMNKTGLEFSELVEDVQLLVLKQLDVRDLIRLERVNRDWFLLVDQALKAATHVDIMRLMAIEKPTEGFNHEKFLYRFRDIQHLALNFGESDSFIDCFPHYSSRIPTAIAGRMMKIEKIGLAHHRDIKFVLDYTRQLRVPSKLKHLEMAFEERPSNSVIKDFVTEFRQLVNLSPIFENVTLIIPDGVALWSELFRFVGRELSPDLKYIQFDHEGPVITSNYLTGVNYKLKELEAGAEFCEPSVVQKYVRFAPNLDFLSLQTNIDSFKLFGQLKNLRRLRLVLVAQGETKKYSNLARKKLVVDFLKVRGKQLRMLILALPDPFCQIDSLSKELVEHAPNIRELLYAQLDYKLCPKLTKLRKLTLFIDGESNSILVPILRHGQNLRLVEVVCFTVADLEHFSEFLDSKNTVINSKVFTKKCCPHLKEIVVRPPMGVTNLPSRTFIF